MADGFVGNYVQAYIDTVTPIDTPGDEMTLANFRLMVCLTNNTFDLNRASIDTSSKCIDGNVATSLPGQLSWTMSADINSEVLDAPDKLVKASHNEIFKIARAGTKIWVAQYDVANKTVRYGVAWISSDSEAYPNNAQSTASITFNGDGKIFDQDDLAGS